MKTWPITILLFVLFFFGFGVYRFFVPETYDGLTARQWEQYGEEQSTIIVEMSKARNIENETLYSCEHGDCPVAPRFRLIILATTTQE